MRALTGCLEYPEAVLSSDVVRDMECNASKLLSSQLYMPVSFYFP
jgi:hypothetical protein